MISAIHALHTQSNNNNNISIMIKIVITIISRNSHCSQMTLNCSYLLYNQTHFMFFKMISTT